MKLTLLLFALGMKLRLSALVSRDFRKLLRKDDFTLVIRTRGGRTARTFSIKRGWVRSWPWRSSSADTELVWCDADTAVRILLSKNDLDAFHAIGSAMMRITGNFKYALRFMDLAA